MQLNEIEIKLEIDEIPDHIVKNVGSIAKIQVQQEQPAHFHLQLLDRLAIFGTRPVFLYTLLAFFILWWTASELHHLGLIDWDIPADRLQDRLLDTMALFISTAILIRQTRQEQVAEEHFQQEHQWNQNLSQLSQPICCRPNRLAVMTLPSTQLYY